MGADIRAKSAREEARKAAREADRAEAEALSIRMEGYGGPAQPSPTISQCISGGLSWLEVECNRCKTRANLPLDGIRRPRDTPIWKLEASLKCRSCRNGRWVPADSGDRGQGFRLNATMQSDRRRPPVPTKAAGVSLPA